MIDDEDQIPWTPQKHLALMSTAVEVCENDADAAICFIMAAVSLVSDREVGQAILDFAYDTVEHQFKEARSGWGLH